MKVRTLFNTLKYLKPIQFFYRIKNKFSPKGKRLFRNVSFRTTDSFIDCLHNDTEYLKRFATNGDRIVILNQSVDLDYRDLSKYSPLVRFNIEYFEYAIVWAQKGITFDHLKTKWDEYVDADLPLKSYVISLQIPNMITAMDIYGIHDQSIYDELYSRYKWLLKHQEKHLLANHFFENLKAIVIASFVFGEDSIHKKYVKKLLKECKEEILDDGVHFELSQMYHKIVLEDLLLVRKICGITCFDKYIESMLAAMYSIEYGFDRTPLFNDSGDNVAKSSRSLIKACKNILGTNPEKQNSFSQSGYYKIDKGNISLLIDAGKVGPDYNPGHAHCDCLSFELCINGEPVLVNSGTYQYQGEKRSFFRSTSAHNTLMVSGREQSEMWGEHRVGRRIKVAKGSVKDDVFSGSCRNQFNEVFNRTISLVDGVFSVLDCTNTQKNGEKVTSFLHLSPKYTLEDGFIVGPKAKYKLELLGCSVRTISSFYSDQFGKIENDQCLVFEWLTDDRQHGYNISLNNKEIN